MDSNPFPKIAAVGTVLLPVTIDLSADAVREFDLATVDGAPDRFLVLRTSTVGDASLPWVLVSLFMKVRRAVFEPSLEAGVPWGDWVMARMFAGFCGLELTAGPLTATGLVAQIENGGAGKPLKITTTYEATQNGVVVARGLMVNHLGKWGWGESGEGDGNELGPAFSEIDWKFRRPEGRNPDAVHTFVTNEKMAQKFGPWDANKHSLKPDGILQGLRTLEGFSQFGTLHRGYINRIAAKPTSPIPHGSTVRLEGFTDYPKPGDFFVEARILSGPGVTDEPKTAMVAVLS